MTAILSAYGTAYWFNVKSYGAAGNGVKDDTTAIQNAMNAAGAVGGTVYFPPGNYLISNHLLWDTSAKTTIQLAPSLIGAPGMSGPSADAGTAGAVQITASGTFPVGEFMIDYIGPAPVGGGGGNTGFRVSGLVLQCSSRAAGIRSFNSEDSEWSYLVINDAAAPNPANTSGSPGGAVNFVASPSFEAWNNRAQRVYVFASAKHAFYLVEGTGSYIYALSCVSVNAGWAGFYALAGVTLIGCLAQHSGVNNPDGGWYYADWELGGATLIGCVSFNGNPVGPGVTCYADAVPNNISSCAFLGTSTNGLSEEYSAVIRFLNGGSTHQHVTLDNCIFATGSHTSDYVYVESSTSGSVVFLGCHFTPSGGAPTVGAYNLNGTAITTFDKCEGINPAGTQSVAVPATTVATAALPFDATFYVTANAAGSCTVAISGGPTITVPASAVVPVFVPAGQTITPTYTNAPTWVVEGQ